MYDCSLNTGGNGQKQQSLIESIEQRHRENISARLRSLRHRSSSLGPSSDSRPVHSINSTNNNGGGTAAGGDGGADMPVITSSSSPPRRAAGGPQDFRRHSMSLIGLPSIGHGHGQYRSQLMSVYNDDSAAAAANNSDDHGDVGDVDGYVGYLCTVYCNGYSEIELPRRWHVVL